MAAPVIVGSGAACHFAWNLSAKVGVSSPNQPDDVQLAQLGYFCAQYGTTQYDAASRAIFAAVVPGALYSRQEYDPLTSAIRAQEKSFGGPQAGQVSVMVNLTSASYDGGVHGYLMIRLNILIMN